MATNVSTELVRPFFPAEDPYLANATGSTEDNSFDHFVGLSTRGVET